MRGLVLLAAMSFLASAPPAFAEAPSVAPAEEITTANAEIIAMRATKEDGGAFVDPRIGKLPLDQKPFSNYNTFRFVERKILPLAKGKSTSHTLATGRTLRVTFQGVTLEKRYAIAAAIDQPESIEYLKLLEVVAARDETFYVGGQAYAGGRLILAISIRR